MNASSPVAIAWFKDGVKRSLCNADCSKSRFMQTFNETTNETMRAILKIKEVRLEDAGVYMCKVNTTYSVAEATTRLTVHSKLNSSLHCLISS